MPVVVVRRCVRRCGGFRCSSSPAPSDCWPADGHGRVARPCILGDSAVEQVDNLPAQPGPVLGILTATATATDPGHDIDPERLRPVTTLLAEAGARLQRRRPARHRRRAHRRKHGAGPGRLGRPAAGRHPHARSRHRAPQRPVGHRLGRDPSAHGPQPAHRPGRDHAVRGGAGTRTSARRGGSGPARRGPGHRQRLQRRGR